MHSFFELFHHCQEVDHYHFNHLFILYFIIFTMLIHFYIINTLTSPFSSYCYIFLQFSL